MNFPKQIFSLVVKTSFPAPRAVRRSMFSAVCPSLSALRCRLLALGSVLLAFGAPLTAQTAGTLVGTLPGEFSVDNKGAANYSIPLAIPPGRGGLQPKLSLNYSSQGGNGPLGVGFSLSTGFPQAITRGRSILARDGVVRGADFSINDKFYLDGKRLIVVSGTYGQPGSTYRTEVDSFVTITTTGTGSDASNWNIETFTVTDKSGTKMIFGKDEGQTDGYHTGAGETEGKASNYALKRVIDILGNTVQFQYGNPVPGEFVLSQINYGGNGSANPTFSVGFTYATRADSPKRYIARRGFPQTVRCAEIATREFSAESSEFINSYTLEYAYEPMGGRSRIVAVRSLTKKSDGTGYDALRPTILEWSDDQNRPASTFTAVRPDLLRSQNVVWGDFDGNGSDETLWTGENTRYRKVADINGDGVADYFDVNLPVSNVSQLNFSCSCATLDSDALRAAMTDDGTPTGSSYVLKSEREGAMSRISLADFTGDGRADILIHGFDGRLRLFRSTGDAFLPAVTSAFVGGTAQVSSNVNMFASFPNQTVGVDVSNHWYVRPMPCDLNGDGITDYVFSSLMRNSTYFDNGGGGGGYWMYNVGRECFGVIGSSSGVFSGVSMVGGVIGYHMDIYPNSTSQSSLYFDQVFAGVMPGDFNGDGMTDFLVLDNKPNQGAPGVFGMAGYRWLLQISKGAGPTGTPEFETVIGAIPNSFSSGGKDIRTYFKPVTEEAWNNMNSLGTALTGPLAGVFASLETAGGSVNTMAMDVNHDGLDDLVWYADRAMDDSPLPVEQKGWWAMLSKGSFVSLGNGTPSGFSAPIKVDTLPAGSGRPVGNGYYAYQATEVMHGVDSNGDGHRDWVVQTSNNGVPASCGALFLQQGADGQVPAQFGGLLKRVAVGTGVDQVIDYVVTEIEFKAAKNPEIYTAGAPVTYPIRELKDSSPVVSSIWKDSGTGNPADRAHFTYQYSGNRLDLSGRGPLGFHSFVTLDTQTNLFKYQFLAQSFPMTGLTARELTCRYWFQNGAVNFRYLNAHDNTVVFDEVVKSPTDSTPWGTVYPFMSKAIESRWEDGPSAHFGFSSSSSTDSKPEELFKKERPAGAHITISALSKFDAQTSPQLDAPVGYNASDRTTDWADAGTNVVKGVAAPTAINGPRKIYYGNLTNLSTNFSDGFTEAVTTAYLPATSNGLTGLVDSVTTTVGWLDGATPKTEDAPVKRFTYSVVNNVQTALVHTETIDAPGDELDLTTEYVRETSGLGRVIETKVTGYGARSDQRLGSLVSDDEGMKIGSGISTSLISSFDAKWDLPTLSKNADPYRHRTSTTYHAWLGLPTAVTDLENSATVTTTYDALGRKIKVRDELKGLDTETAHAWTTAGANDWTKTQPVSVPSGVTGGLALSSAYAVRTTATVQPPVTAYFDRLGRTIRTIKEGYGTQRTITDTIYNNLGQVVAVSLPYLEGTTPLWTKTTYDPLGRVVTVTAPNGTVTTNTYRGRITQVTVDARASSTPANDPTKLQTNSTLVDAKGRTIKVWNADNPPTLSNIPGSDIAASSTTTASIEYVLDGFGRMRKTKLKDQSQEITADYDGFGRQTSLNDPDKGLWTYKNNALGHVVRQTDAKGNVTRSTFDRLGRPLTRETREPNSGPVETANWYYYDWAANATLHLGAKNVGDNAAGQSGWIGAAQSEESKTLGAPGYEDPGSATVHYYDNKGRSSLNVSLVDSKWFYTFTDYDAYSRVAGVRYYWRPPGFELPSNSPTLWKDWGYTYLYDGTGTQSKSYLIKVADTANRTWWEAEGSTGYDHLDRPVRVRKGSGHWTERTYRAIDGTLASIRTGPNLGNGDVQDLAFEFDGLGNLTKRKSQLGATNPTESFTYDNLNRLTNSSISGAIAYAPNGNILAKLDVSGNPSGTYTYDGAKPHAVANAFGYAMTYDANGNLLTRSSSGQTWATRWAGFDKPRWLARDVSGSDFQAGATGSEFLYNANRSRVIHLEFDRMSGGVNGVPSHYTSKKLYAMGAAMEADYKNSAGVGVSASWQLDRIRIYVPGPEGNAGTIEFGPTATFSLPDRALVYHYDHLGSIESITPYGSSANSLALEDGGSPGRYSEDPWGQRRNQGTWSGAVTSTPADLKSLTPRGFTGHEMLDGLGLVHMNGRIYDALLGRMLSADLVVQNPGSLQDFNRYSYVKNNPLTLTDPSGFCYQIHEEQAQRNLRQHAYDIGVGQQYDDGRLKASIAITVGMAATAATAGLAPEALAATIPGRILIAEVSGAAGGAASNMADNAMNGRPITENNSIAMTVGAVGGMAGQVLDEAATAAMRSTSASSTTTAAAAQADGPNPAVAPVTEAEPVTPAPTEIGAIQTAQPATTEIRGGRYGHLEDGPTVGSGKVFTATQKAKILAENEKANGGVLRDDVTGETGVRPQQSQKGVTPPENEVQVDHYYPRAEGGPNSYSNAEVRLRKHNIKKSDEIPE